MKSLCALLWKELMMTKRQKISTIYRMVFPWLLMILVLYIRSRAVDNLSDYVELKEDKLPDNKTTVSRCILYTPNSKLAGILMAEVGRQLGLSRLTAMPHKSPCNGYYPNSNYDEIAKLVTTFSGNEFAVCIIFEDMDVESWSSRRQDKLTYTIQIDAKFNKSSYNSALGRIPPDRQRYGDIYDDFILIQKAIDKSYVKVRSEKKEPQKLSVQEFPHFRDTVSGAPTYLERIFQAFLFFYIIMISAVNLFTHIMARMCSERAAGIQELIKMNGVSTTTMGIVYFINSIPPALSLSIGCSIMFKCGKFPVIEQTSALYIFIGFALYAVSLLAFGMACSYVLNKSRFATVLAIFIFIATMLMNKFILMNPPKNWALKLLSGMVWHTPLFWLFHEIFIYEFLGKPTTISLLTSKLNEQGSILEAYICLILQSLLYFALTWYLSYVRQGKYGNSLPWNFLCKKKVDESAIIAAYREVREERYSKYFEEPPTSMQAGIQIMNVSKYYPKPALSDVSLNVYKGEITVLLGHNGAGKTTLISIITGMTTASQGKVLVKGIDTASNSLQVRKQIGLCTQHNLFIDHLNAIEHVMFFNMLKSKSEKYDDDDSQKLLDKLGIGKKSSAMPEQLSGGMKRRLQLACALAGGSDVLVLDEPTSGLDVETRRELWNLLLSLRGERTVLLSTHFMEEADALGDRIAALHTGHLRCHATPMYLKKAMGGGYRLTLITSGKPKEKHITDIVTTYVKDATVRGELMNTITYNLPSSATPQFPELFSALETNRTALEISSIGVGISTMEEVFLFLCSDSDTFNKQETDTEVTASEYGKIKGIRLYMRQAIALFKRHLKFIWECKFTFPIMQIIIPALLIYLFTLSCNNRNGEEPALGTLMDLNIHKPLSKRRALYSAVFRGAAPLALNLLSNIVAPEFLVASRSAINTYNHPVGRNQELNIPPASGAKDLFSTGFWAMLVGSVILFTSHNLHALPSREGASGARHLHVMAGCPAALHWLCTLAFHTALTLLTMVPVTIICAYVCDHDNTFTNARFLLTLGLILIVGHIAFFAMTYLLVMSFNGKTANGLAIALILWSALFSTTKVFGSMLGVELESFEYLSIVITNALPSFAMIAAIGQTAYIARLNALCEVNKHRCPKMLLMENKGFDEKKCCAGESEAYMSFGEYTPTVQILIMLVQGIVLMTLVILIQMGYASCFCDRLLNSKFKEAPVRHVDELVTAEATRVDQEIGLPEQQIIDHNKAVLVSHLHKIYNSPCKGNHAVKGISFSVNKGECFGLLGLNGAGKSTTFKMITSEVCPTFGRIFANGVFLDKRKKEFLRMIGYCPQFLGIDEFQTGSDNLRTLLTIRGLDDKDIDKEMKAWIAVVGLQKFANMRASTYSGGYKRRLAAAAALCSGAPLSLLDEPTAGVDVVARRLVHAALRKSLSRGDSIVITSHSMDEMEALCTRIAILAGGRIRALGTLAELRMKYAQGYSLKLKVKQKQDGNAGGITALVELKSAVTIKFNCELKDEHTTMLHYHIIDKMRYSEIFSRLEDLQQLFPDTIEDYSINETTLEEVFLHLAKEHLLKQQAAVEAAALKSKPNKLNLERTGTSSKV